MKLVPDWHLAWKWFSVQALAILAVIPMVWINLPPDLKAYIPTKYGVYITIAVALAGISGRVIDQTPKEKAP